MTNCDFLLEHRLKELDSQLAYRHACCASLFEQMLKKFLTMFPTFTDHTLLHTLSVANISNQLLRENVGKLNAAEIYIYLMACALHDIGMGVSHKDLPLFIDAAGLRDYVDAHPELSKPDLIRAFHHDFSAQFVTKYWELLEIPSLQYAQAIAEVGRGHRKTDLMDEALYPVAFDLGDGRTANLALLAALIRLCDELDIASDRNPDLLYDIASIEGMSKSSAFEFAKHEAIRAVNFEGDCIVVVADTNHAYLMEGIVEAINTVKQTMAYCLAVMEQRSDVAVDCKKIKLILNGKEAAV